MPGILESDFIYELMGFAPKWSIGAMEYWSDGFKEIKEY